MSFVIGAIEEEIGVDLSKSRLAMEENRSSIMRTQAYVLTQVGPPLPKQRSTIHSGSPPLNVSGEGSGNMYTNNSLGSAAARSKFAILPASVPPSYEM